MAALVLLGVAPAPGASPPAAFDGPGPAALSGELAVTPAPGSWTADPSPRITVQILNESFVPFLDVTVVALDGARLLFDWDEAERTLTAEPPGPLADGDHSVHVRIEDAGGKALEADWTYFQDTVRPHMSLDPLPPVADRRVFSVNGTVVEDNLSGVWIGNFPASIRDDRFLVPVLLWPGHNDLLAVGIDKAGNRGLAKGEIHWFPPAVANVTYVATVHPNASFIVRVPSSWEAHLDYDLEAGFRAEFAAFEPANLPPRSSIAVVSRLAGASMTDGLLLSILQDAILRVGNASRVEVISSPRFVDIVPGTVTAQFSIVETLSDGSRVFRLVTGYWNRAAGRVWLLTGAAAVEKVESQWHAIQTASGTFQVVPPPAPPATGEPPRASVDRALLVTIGAIVVVLAVFAAGLYSFHRRTRGARR